MLPFDRHDWYVDRCGKQVRYVIDFYFDERHAGSPDAFSVDARPALDDLGSVVDRTKMGVRASCCSLACVALRGQRYALLVTAMLTTCVLLCRCMCGVCGWDCRARSPRRPHLCPTSRDTAHAGVRRDCGNARTST